jgi:hypothetical protein
VEVGSPRTGQRPNRELGSKEWHPGAKLIDEQLAALPATDHATSGDGYDSTLRTRNRSTSRLMQRQRQ